MDFPFTTVLQTLLTSPPLQSFRPSWLPLRYNPSDPPDFPSATILQILPTPSALNPLFLRSQIFLFLSLCPVPLLWWPFTGDFLRNWMKGNLIFHIFAVMFLILILIIYFYCFSLKSFQSFSSREFSFMISLIIFPWLFSSLRILFTWVLDLLDWSFVYLPCPLVHFFIFLFTFWGFSINLFSNHF